VIRNTNKHHAPKSNQLSLVTHRTPPKTFIKIRPRLFLVTCSQTNTQMPKHNLLGGSRLCVLFTPRCSTLIDYTVDTFVVVRWICV